MAWADTWERTLNATVPTYHSMRFRVWACITHIIRMAVPDHPSPVNERLSSFKVDNNKDEVIKNRAVTEQGALASVARRSRLKPAWKSCMYDRCCIDA